MYVDGSVFREYDIRGIWQKNINEEFCRGLGVAYGRYLKQRCGHSNPVVTVGYDARLSSEDIFRHLCMGLALEGVKVVSLGLVPTPVQYFSLFKLSTDGGVMITASHNPKEYNGFKLSVGKETLYGEEIQHIREQMEKLDPVAIDHAPTPQVDRYDILKDYTAFMMDQFGYLFGSEHKPAVVLDGGNGVGGFVGYDIMKRLGFDVKGLYIEPDGTFPNHHPDPTVEENLRDLKRVLKEEHYQIGIGYDGDADRIGVVLKNGEILYGDQLLLLFAQDILSDHPGAKIIGEVKCSQVLFDGIKEAGGVPIMYKAGHSLIKSKMKQEHALLAGEMSGHIFFADRYFGYDDAIYASLRLLEIVVKRSLDLIQWKRSLPKTYNTPEIRIECPDEKKRSVVEKLKAYLESHADEFDITHIHTIDGIRFNTHYGWGLIRSSNTQPALVLRFEANTKDKLEELKSKTLSLVERTIKQET